MIIETKVKLKFGMILTAVDGEREGANFRIISVHGDKHLPEEDRKPRIRVRELIGLDIMSDQLETFPLSGDDVVNFDLRARFVL